MGTWQATSSQTWRLGQGETKITESRVEIRFLWREFTFYISEEGTKSVKQKQTNKRAKAKTKQYKSNRKVEWQNFRQQTKHTKLYSELPLAKLSGIPSERASQVLLIGIGGKMNHSSFPVDFWCTLSKIDVWMSEEDGGEGCRGVSGILWM